MLDAAVRRVIDPSLNRAGRVLAGWGVRANQMTLVGFAIGLAAIPALAYHNYGIALALIIVNRLFDGLDGAVARATQTTDLGGYLDIVCDFVFYAGVVFGFALALPEAAITAAFLLFSFMGTAASFLACAVMAAKRNLSTRTRGIKSLYYLGGLTEGTETIAIFIAFSLFPDLFVPLAIGYGVLCWITTVSRVAWAVQLLGDE